MPSVTCYDRAAAERELAHLRTVRAEADTLLASAKEDVSICLDAVSRAIERERAFLNDRSDVADGEIAVPYALLSEAIQRLRKAQALIKTLDSRIEESVQELADDELWKVA